MRIKRAQEIIVSNKRMRSSFLFAIADDSNCNGAHDRLTLEMPLDGARA